MSEEVLYVRVKRTTSKWGKTSKQVIEEIVSQLPEEIRSGGVDIDEMLYKAGIIAAGLIKKAFVTKSGGGTDEAGERWAPLKPKTVAYSRKAGRTKRETSRETHPSQALTKKQQERWWELYRQGLARYRGNKSHAARRAWFIIKGEGATTLLDKYGGARVNILRVTDTLLNSILPSVEDGEIVVRAGAKYAAAHHYGTENIPQRRLWPEPSKWPDSWWNDIARSIKNSLAEIIAKRTGDR